MWRQRRLEKQQSHDEKVDRPQRGPPLVRLEEVAYFSVNLFLLVFCLFIYLFIFSSYRGRLVSDTLSPSRSSKRDSSPPSYYWTRLLMKEEESDPFRYLTI